MNESNDVRRRKLVALKRQDIVSTLIEKAGHTCGSEISGVLEVDDNCSCREGGRCRPSKVIFIRINIPIHVDAGCRELDLRTDYHILKENERKIIWVWTRDVAKKGNVPRLQLRHGLRWGKESNNSKQTGDDTELHFQIKGMCQRRVFQ